MRKVWFAVLFLICFAPVYAKDEIPEALMNAKTAAVENARAEQKDFDKLIEHLTKWGRFELVQDKSKADIVITLTREAREQMVNGPGGRMQNQQYLTNRINIFQREGNALLWSDETSSYSKDPKSLVSKLKSKLKSK